MWLSKQTGRATERASTAPLRGTVTLSDAEAAVYTDAERRGLAVCAPGGYFWRPELKDEVLVVKESERGYVVAALPERPPDIKPGEILLQTGAASLRLSPDGRVAIDGEKVTVNGISLFDEEG